MLRIEVPNEIRAYREKIFFGMSLRQLGFTVLAVGVAVSSYFVLEQLLHVPSSIAAYIIVALCAPFMALGFIRVHGLTFEQFVRVFFRHRKRGIQPRVYTARLRIDTLYPDDIPGIPYVKRTDNRKRRRKNAALEESKSIEAKNQKEKNE